MTDFPLTDEILMILSVGDAPETATELYALIPDCHPAEIREALDVLAAADLIWWSRPTGDLAIVSALRLEIGVTD